MDYPYVRFNTKLDKLDYSNEEYIQLITVLKEGNWNRQEDDELCRMAILYDLRWPV